eukprot:TRINITY_DN4856_c0_g1::TRINITY_DN4856_c0_g1_i1::g.915::m.915 TRINITY_DN4856_c0_g1::TRINITY_DN4856_c0_g1_i1::g.915  ORF type:complete len:217 (+),score=48.17,sp/Q9BRD0/BUD13_HUMAN/42.34/1e-37,Bud13/PF09736.4/1.6e-38,DUF1168/PF06658.7/0.9 TRINITY_DN4856_c0_g1_i1:62-652(+)
MSSGQTAGLHAGAALRADAERARLSEKERLKTMDTAATGSLAKTVYRDKTGKKVSEEELKALKRKTDKRYKDEDDDGEWRRGTAQKRQEEEAMQQIKKAAAQPFARTADDFELNSYQRDIIRDGDPMAHMIKVKPSSDDRPRYRGPAPDPNRFGISPGHRWDGVDRSNGFENKRWKMLNERKAVSLDSYKWSVEDM